jgi:hypothetical protein
VADLLSGYASVFLNGIHLDILVEVISKYTPTFTICTLDILKLKFFYVFVIHLFMDQRIAMVLDSQPYKKIGPFH